jgi:1-phosphofructokinase family hexose kinase
VILTVTLNPAIDVTYHVDALTLGATHRVSRVDERLGGKGINVASVLAQLGEPVSATGLLRDGPDGFTPIAAAPRRTVVVTDGRDATGFWEPGPVVTPSEWAAFTAGFAALAASARVVVFSGSLPGGLPDNAYASLIGLARSAGCRTILDTSGPALTQGMLGRPDVVKPNTAELEHLWAARGPRLAELGEAPSSQNVPLSARADQAVVGESRNLPLSAQADQTVVAESRNLPLSAQADETVVVESHGAEGLRALRWQARPPRHIAGNPTGAGDACVAALARGLLHGTAWPELLRDAVALSAAAVASPVAGHVDLELYQALKPEVIVKES